MGNLRQKYTTEEWDEMVDSTKPGFVEKRIEQAIHEAAKKYGLDIGNKNGTAQFDFTAGAKWMLENFKANFK